MLEYMSKGNPAVAALDKEFYEPDARVQCTVYVQLSGSEAREKRQALTDPCRFRAMDSVFLVPTDHILGGEYRIWNPALR